MRSQEQSVFWRAPQLGDLELLRASYVTHTFPRHAHDGYAIGVIERGAETFEYRRQWFVAPAGSVVVINPGEVHTGQAVTPHGWSYRMLYPDAALLQQAAIEAGGRTRAVPFFPSPVLDDPQLAQWMLHLHATLEQPITTLEQQSRFVWILAHLITRHADDRPRVLPVGKEHHAVQQVRAYLEAHYPDNVSLDQLAALINFSLFHLVRVFRAAIGLLLMRRVSLSGPVERWLRYVPGAVLVAPTIAHGGLATAFATAATIVVAARSKSLVLVMVAGVGVVWLLRL